MITRGYRPGIAGGALVVAIGLAALLAPWGGAAQEGGQNVEPREGYAGQRFDFYATGFDDEEPVGFWGTRPDGVAIGDGAGQVFSNDDGRADWFWVAPPGAQPGTWLIAAEGVDSGQLRTFRVEVLGAGQPAPQQPQQPPAQPAPQQPQQPPAEPIAVSPPTTAASGPRAARGASRSASACPSGPSAASGCSPSRATPARLR
jgi:hypothetical protein